MRCQKDSPIDLSLLDACVGRQNYKQRVGFLMRTPQSIKGLRKRERERKNLIWLFFVPVCLLFLPVAFLRYGGGRLDVLSYEQVKAVPSFLALMNLIRTLIHTIISTGCSTKKKQMTCNILEIVLVRQLQMEFKKVVSFYWDICTVLCPNSIV